MKICSHSINNIGTRSVPLISIILVQLYLYPFQRCLLVSYYKFCTFLDILFTLPHYKSSFFTFFRGLKNISLSNLTHWTEVNNESTQFNYNCYLKQKKDFEQSFTRRLYSSLDCWSKLYKLDGSTSEACAFTHKDVRL